MSIRFEGVIPQPLEGNPALAQSEIWNTEICFDQGKNYQITAPSGKGKSTFIHLIYGLRDDFRGRVWVEEKQVAAMRASEKIDMRKSLFSVVFQDLRLFLQLSAFENIALRAAVAGINADKEIEAAAQRLGIAHVLHKKAALLSYGERQRTALIRALISPFKYLLLDEPFSHLDPENTQKACKLIEERCRKYGASFLMTSLGFDYPLSIDEKKRL